MTTPDLLTTEERLSGMWIDESTALEISGITKEALSRRRTRGLSLHAKPLEILPKSLRPRSYWYLLSDIEQIAAEQKKRISAMQQAVLSGPTDPQPAATNSMTQDQRFSELEVSMLRAEARAHELAAKDERIRSLESELAVTRSELERMRRVVVTLAQPGNDFDNPQL